MKKQKKLEILQKKICFPPKLVKSGEKWEKKKKKRKINKLCSGFEKS